VRLFMGLNRLKVQRRMPLGAYAKGSLDAGLRYGMYVCFELVLHIYAACTVESIKETRNLAQVLKKG